MSAKTDDYQSAMKFIFNREHFGIKLGLENIGRFLEKIDNPHRNYPSVHIAGTNGKGSTAVFIESILRQAGYKTGIFTSPHLVDFRERIRVNDKQISKRYIAEFITRHRWLIGRNKITFFEVCTALAFCYFSDKKVDIAIVEVGLGGRLDATNTLRPALSVITDISFDHTNILGNSLKKIAWEKAGIIKNGIPILPGLMKPEPRNKIKTVAHQRKAPLLYLKPKDFSPNGHPFGFDYNHGPFNLNSLRPALPGKHQIKNSALAVRACEYLSENGFKIGPGAIRLGLKGADWAGRFQIIKKPGQPRLILDVGHNPAGVKAMVDCFRQLFPNQRADLVIGFVRNKNLKQSIGYLRPITRRVEAVRMSTSRTAEPEEVAAYFGRSIEVGISDSVSDSVRKFRQTADTNDNIIVCGSHFLVGEFLRDNKIK